LPLSGVLLAASSGSSAPSLPATTSRHWAAGALWALPRSGSGCVTRHMTCGHRLASWTCRRLAGDV